MFAPPFFISLSNFRLKVKRGVRLKKPYKPYKDFKLILS